MNCRFKVIRLTADESLIKNRLSKKRPYSDADFRIYQQLKSDFETIQGDHLVLDSTNTSIEEMKRKSREFIDQA